MREPIKSCAKCKSDFFPKTKSNIYCSRLCADTHYKERSREVNTFVSLSKGSIGALAELMACADLIRSGYEVFRAMSPDSNCDVIGIKDGEVYKFEVRTGNYFLSQSGGKTLHYPKHRTDGKAVIVVTHSDNTVHYITNGLQDPEN